MTLKRAFGVVATVAATALCAVGAATAQAATDPTVSGSVTVPSGAVAADTYAVLMHNGAAAQIEQLTAGTPTTNGTYSFSGVDAGTYQVYFVDPNGADDAAPVYYDGATSYASAGTVTVGSSDVALNATTLTSGGEVEGTVTDQNTGTSHSIAACPTATADAGQAAFWDYYSGSNCAGGTIATDGSYTIGGLIPSANYNLQYTLSSSSPSYTDTVYADGSSVTVDPGSATNVTPAGSGTVTATSFTVPAVGTVSGAVTDPGGLADQGGSFVLTDAAGTEIDRSAALSSGAYTLAGVIPGQYRVEFIPNSATLTDAFSGNSTTLDAASYVTVSSGTTTANVNLATEAGATISGAVTSAQGSAPLGGIRVEVVSASGEVIARSVSNANGTYTVSHVPTGSWHLEFVGGVAYNGVRYQNEYYGAKTTLAGSKSITFAAGATLKNYNQAMMAQSATAAGLPTLTKGWTAGEANNKTILRFALNAGAGPAGYVKAFKLRLPTLFDWNRSSIKSHLDVVRNTGYSVSFSGSWLYVNLATAKKLVTVRLNAGAISLGGNRHTLAKEHKLGKQTFKVWVRDTVGMSRTDTYTAKNPH